MSRNSTLSEERDLRLKVVLEAAKRAGLPRVRGDLNSPLVAIPDNTCHDVQIPARLFIAFCEVVAVAAKIRTLTAVMATGGGDTADLVHLTEEIGQLGELVAHNHNLHG